MFILFWQFTALQ